LILVVVFAMVMVNEGVESGGELMVAGDVALHIRSA